MPTDPTSTLKKKITPNEPRTRRIPAVHEALPPTLTTHKRSFHPSSRTRFTLDRDHEQRRSWEAQSLSFGNHAMLMFTLLTALDFLPRCLSTLQPGLPSNLRYLPTSPPSIIKRTLREQPLTELVYLSGASGVSCRRGQGAGAAGQR